MTAKLLPSIQILNQIQGVTEPVVTPQQGGEVDQNPPIPPKVIIKTELKVNVASSSGGQEKPKGVVEDSDDE